MAAHQPSIDSLLKDRDISPSRKSVGSDDAKSASIDSPALPFHDLEKQYPAPVEASADPPAKSDASLTDPNLVDWEGDNDPESPLLWPFRRKIWMTFLVALMTLCISITSSIWSEDVEVTAKEFNTSREVMILGISLYVLGFASGPLIFGPISELMGSPRPLVLGFLCYTIFQIPVAVAQNLETIFICRFLAAAFGAAAVAIAPGILVDLWDPSVRAIATLLWALTVFAGPTVGPLVGAYTVLNPNLGWRWTAWLMLIIGAMVLVISVPTTRETFAPILLQRKDARLRYETRNWALHSKRDEDPITFGSFVIIIGLFWFAWTSAPSIAWVPQVLAGIPIGCGIFLVFVPGQVYIMDVYPDNAASAMAGNAFVRAALAFAFPLAGEYMYETLGVDWGMSLLGFLCVALAPFPILFYIFGPRLRKMSKFAPE